MAGQITFSSSENLVALFEKVERNPLREILQWLRKNLQVYLLDNDRLLSDLFC